MTWLPCQSSSQLSPAPRTSTKRGLCSAGAAWKGDRQPLTQQDVILKDLRIALCGGLEWGGIQRAAISSDTGDWERGFNEHLLVSAQNVSV